MSFMSDQVLKKCLINEEAKENFNPYPVGTESDQT